MASQSEDRRLWIGNLDPRINEYQLLKLVQKYGSIEKFDLLFHRNGPLSGQPRGYAFVTYVRKEDALKAKEMHNKLVGSKNVIVTWAHSVPNEDLEKPRKADVNIPALSLAKMDKKTDRLHQIQAIEAKLKLMENQNSKELEINKTVSEELPIISQYQQNKNATSSKLPQVKRNTRQNYKPYKKY